MSKYSIILRAYNAQEQIGRSIESIISQNYENWELLVVNDGSTDFTGKISEEYAKKDKRIKVIHQENSGCVLATQKGVECANGEYICVLDADDWYEKDYLEHVDSIICNNDVDMVITNYYMVNQDESRKKFSLVEEDVVKSAKDSMMLFFKTTNYALWNKVVKKELIQYLPEEIQFFKDHRKTTNFGEDLFQLIPVACACKNIYFTSKNLYNYVVDDMSISHQAVKNHWEEINKRNRLMQFAYNAIFQRQCMDEDIKKRIQLNTVKVLISNMSAILESKKFDKKMLRELKENSFYGNVVMKTNFFELKRKLGSRKAIVFWVFNIITLLS